MRHDDRDQQYCNRDDGADDEDCSPDEHDVVCDAELACRRAVSGSARSIVARFVPMNFQSVTQTSNLAAAFKLNMQNQT